jgi:hypothetical protein
VGTILIALAARRLSAMGGSAVLGAPSAEQLAELIESARASELRAVEAESRLQYVTGNEHAAPRLDDDFELLRSRGGGLRRFALWSFVVMVGAGSAYAYFAGYAPLKQQLTVQRQLSHTHAEQQAATIVDLRAQLERERDTARQAARAAEPAPVAVTTPQSTAVPSVVSPTVRDEPATSAAPKSKPSAASRIEVRRTRTSEVRGTSKADGRERASDAPSTRAPAKSLRELRAVEQAEAPKQNRSPVPRSDDPLEGLDGM